MRYPDRDRIHWQFDTPNFRVVFHVEPEDMSPRDHFEFPEDVEAVESGDVAWFTAFVSVWEGSDENGLTYLAHDCLGGCAYTTVREFYTAHRDKNPMNRNSSVMRAAHKARTGTDKITICHYFPDMVAQAISEARKVATAKLVRATV